MILKLIYDGAFMHAIDETKNGKIGWNWNVMTKSVSFSYDKYKLKCGDNLKIIATNATFMGMPILPDDVYDVYDYEGDIAKYKRPEHVDVFEKNGKPLILNNVLQVKNWLR